MSSGIAIFPIVIVVSILLLGGLLLVLSSRGKD